MLFFIFIIYKMKLKFLFFNIILNAKYIFILSAWDGGFKVVVFDWLLTFTNVKLVKIINNLNIFSNMKANFLV